MRPFLKQRILAVDLHPRSFAFAVFEGPSRLLDWGARSFRKGTNAVQVDEGPKLARLLDRYSPRLILLQRPATREIHHMLAAIKKEAAARRIPIHMLSSQAVRKTFSRQRTNKYQIASAVAVGLPELRTILPPKRRPWESERYNMSIFDAAAVGLAHFGPASEELSTNLSNGPQG